MRAFNRTGVFCVLALLICSAFGCTTPAKAGNGQYCIYEVGDSDAAGGGGYASEYPLWSSENLNGYQDADAKKKVTVTFNGKNYTGQYIETSIVAGQTHFSHEYFCSEALFEINAETGELSSISLLMEDDESAKKCDEATCRSIADEFASKYISLDEYTVHSLTSPEDLATSSDTYGSYAYVYFRQVGGHRTADQLSVSVREDGKLISWGVRELGSFKDTQEVSFDEAEALNLVEKKVSEIHSSLPGEKDFEINNKILIKLKEDKIGLLYTVTISHESRIDEEYTAHMSEQIKLLVTYDV